MAVDIYSDELSPRLKEAVDRQILSVFAGRPGRWKVNVVPDLMNQALDVIVWGPGTFYFERHFSKWDRAAQVIGEAVRAALSLAA